MVGPELQSTIDLLSRAFPARLDDASYRGAVCVLGPHMSYRAIASVMAALTGKDEAITYHDALKADAGTLAAVAEIEAAHERLSAVGLDAWIAEDE